VRERVSEALEEDHKKPKAQEGDCYDDWMHVVSLSVTLLFAESVEEKDTMYKNDRRSSADGDVVCSLALPCAHFIPHRDYQTVTCTTNSRPVGIERNDMKTEYRWSLRATTEHTSKFSALPLVL